MSTPEGNPWKTGNYGVEYLRLTKNISGSVQYLEGFVGYFMQTKLGPFPDMAAAKAAVEQCARLELCRALVLLDRGEENK